MRRLNDGRPVSGSSRTDCLVAMDDRYMGFATRDELVPALNELLDAERAGASVTLQTAKEAPEPLKSVVMSMQRDEARWRGAPTKAIQQLHGRPSPKTGAFYGKAMTIPDMTARLTFLYRGQGWVVRKLEALLPTVRMRRCMPNSLRCSSRIGTILNWWRRIHRSLERLETHHEPKCTFRSGAPCRDHLANSGGDRH